MLFAEKPAIFDRIQKLIFSRSGNTGYRILTLNWAQSSVIFFFKKEELAFSSYLFFYMSPFEVALMGIAKLE